MRCLILSLILLSLASPAFAQAPRFKKNQPYAEVQRSLLAQGWKPARPPGTTCEGHLCDREKGEVVTCAGTGLGQCITLWRKGGVLVEVGTRGDELPVVDRVRCRTNCRR